MEVFDRGSAVLLEVTANKRTPFVGVSAFDASSVTATVIDPLGVVVTNAVNLTKHAVGKYYVVIQTLETWEIGIYTVEVRSSDGIISDLTVPELSFKLK